MITQATVRGNTVHFQQGVPGSYQKGDITDAALAERVRDAIVRGRGVNTSLYGSSTLYVQVTPPPAPTNWSLPDGSQVQVPSNLA